MVVRVIPRHLLQTHQIRLDLRNRIDRALQVVFVGPVDAVLNVERHHLQRAWRVRRGGGAIAGRERGKRGDDDG